MNYRYLGKTGLKVSELCLGAMTFGRENEATEEESFQMMDRFVASGGNFIDTANVYSTGISEEIVGRWLSRQRRDDLGVGTKVWFQSKTYCEFGGSEFATFADGLHRPVSSALLG